MKIRLLILLVILSSCSPKGFDFKSGDKEGVRFKRSIPPRTQKALTVLLFVGISPIFLIIE